MDLIKQYKNFIFPVAGILAFIFIAFVPAVDLLGKAKVGGLVYVCEEDFPIFSRIMMLLCILAPLASVVVAFRMKGGQATARRHLVIYALAVVLALLTLAALPEGCTFAAGGWMYVLFCALGAGAAALIASEQQ